MGLGCAWTAAYVAVLVWLNLALVLFCFVFAEFWCLLLTLFCISEVLLLKLPSGTRVTPWSGFYLLAAPGTVPVLCSSTTAHAVTDSLIIYLDF